MEKMRFLRDLLQAALRAKGYEIRKKIPNPTMDAVRLLMAWYFAAQPQARVVQIGACDGLNCDPLHDFLRQGRIHALLVEPMPYSVRKLRKTYTGVSAVEIVEAAVFHQDTTVAVYGVKEGSPSSQSPDGGLLASFDRDHLIRYGIPPGDIQSYQVEALTLETLLARHGLEKIDLLQIDTEGFDAEIVRMALQLPTLPDAINFEKKLLSVSQLKATYDALEARGYFFLHDEMNTLAVLPALYARLAVAR